MVYTVQGADQILVLDKGCIAEQGDHKALLALDGQYRRMVALQERMRDWSQAVGA